MSTLLASVRSPVTGEASGETDARWRVVLRDRQIDRVALALGLCAVPLSIAVAESLLGLAVLGHVVRMARRQASLNLPRVFWFWLAWAGLEVLSWCLSPEMRAGWSEMRHLVLVAALFFVLPALHRASYRAAVWRGIFLSATLSSAFLVGDFVSRLAYYRREISVSADTSLYLRSGGLLNHWMVYGTVEILVVAGLLSFWFLYPEERRRWWPVAAINALAIVLSLTRTVWICCLLLLGMELAWRRSRLFWALPLLPLAFYGLAPGAVRSQIKESMSPDFYSNSERVQMWRVGWRMIKEKPLTGIGPGRVGKLYRSYLTAGEPVPAYHGHLHNNLVQLAAQFGLPVAIAALLFVGVLFRDLWRALRKATSREEQFSCRTSILGLTGFIAAGMFDYTYGHSLGLILVSFAVLAPLLSVPEVPSAKPRHAS